MRLFIDLYLRNALWREEGGGGGGCAYRDNRQTRIYADSHDFATISVTNANLQKRIWKQKKTVQHVTRGTSTNNHPVVQYMGKTSSDKANYSKTSLMECEGRFLHHFGDDVKQKFSTIWDILRLQKKLRKCSIVVANLYAPSFNNIYKSAKSHIICYHRWF